MHPRYVSTVDSGNLAGAFIAMAAAGPQTVAQRVGGLADAANLLAQATQRSDQPAVARSTVTEINRVARAIADSALDEASEDAVTTMV